MGRPAGGPDSGGEGPVVIFRELGIAGAFCVAPERHVDERGSFARVWCAREFEQHGLSARLVQSSISTNARKGTLRGMHYSSPPHAEAKLVRCVRGAVHDVLLDLRPTSRTYLQWVKEVLTSENGLALYVPEGVAHGFQTLEDSSDVLYQMSEFFDAACARGVRWDDEAFGISWPDGPRILSERDRTYPAFDRHRR
jgi:dTDP-4-dehydrorhamnose 3,5-epimerase